MKVCGRVIFTLNTAEYDAFRQSFEKNYPELAASLFRTPKNGDSGITIEPVDGEIPAVAAAIESAGLKDGLRASDNSHDVDLPDVTLDTLQVLKNAVGHTATIRELSNRAGIRYSCMRNLIAELGEKGLLIRKGRTITDFNMSEACTTLFPER